MSMVPVEKPAATAPGAWSFLCVTFAAGFAAAFIFAAFPQIDLAVSGWFHSAESGFVFRGTGIGSVIRDLLRLLFALVCIAAVVGFIALAFFNRKFSRFGLAAWAYIALCAAIGPGLVANVGFKDHWGRARPVHVTEFGGTKQFTPPMLRTDQCERNCAFVSGEAANYFMLGFAFAFLLGTDPGRRRKLFLAAIAAGSFAGLIRIAAGGHFLSDVVFAGLFMAFVARGLAWLVLERWGPHLEDSGRFHQATLRQGALTAERGKQLYGRTRERLRRTRKEISPGADRENGAER
ncbi:MAG: phosphatase PAP2 family protein [Rhodomicrobiaceae bacterium]